jgi:hypothetical protein
MRTLPCNILLQIKKAKSGRPCAIAVLQDELEELAAQREEYERDDSGFTTTTMTARIKKGRK